MDPKTALAAATNPLIARIRVPGQTFPLPSGGLFYTNGELSPDCQNGEVHVYPMTAIDELVMKSVDKVFSGAAVKEIFSRCIPQVLDAGRLSAKDVDYLLVALRKVSYGSEFSITYTHTCEGAKEHEYQMSLDTFLQGVKPINAVTMDQVFAHTLPNGQVVKYAPASYDDMVKLYQTQHGDLMRGEEPTAEEQLERAIESVSVLVGAVDDITDRALIKEWLKSVPISWLRDISNGAQPTTSWGVTFEVKLQCKDCKEHLDVPTPLNPISFFI